MGFRAVLSALWAKQAGMASRVSKMGLPGSAKMRRNVLLVWLALTAVVSLGYLGRRRGAAIVQSVQPYHRQPEEYRDGLWNSNPVLAGEKVAVIVETRMTDNLIPILMHFSSVLGPSWPVVLFAKGDAVWEMPTAGPFARAVADKRIRILYIPPGVDMPTYQSVSVFWTRRWIWEQLQHVDRVLTFQTDSIICSRANVTADDFLEWDFIGAPVNPFFGGRGYNGGFSIRNPKKFLSIVTDNDFDKDFQTGKFEISIEDQWFYTKLWQMDDSYMPSVEVSKKFSVETFWYETPLGYHQPHEWNKDRIPEIKKYCPEVEMIYR